MISGNILTEVQHMQSQMLALQTRYEADCDERLQVALKRGQAALTEIIDTAKKLIETTPYLNASCPQCRSNEARLEKKERLNRIYYSLACSRCGYEDTDVSDY